MYTHNGERTGRPGPRLGLEPGSLEHANDKVTAPSVHGYYSDMDLLCSRLLWPTRTRRTRRQIHTNAGSRVVFSEAPTEDALLWRLVDVCYHCKVIPLKSIIIN